MEGSGLQQPNLLLKGNPGELHLGGRYIGPDNATILAASLRHNRSLKKLYLWGNSIGEQGGVALAETLQQNAVLHGLDISENDIGDAGGVALADALRHNSTLQQLYLSKNRIGDKGGVALAYALRQNTSLKVLYLLDNMLGDEAAVSLADAVRHNTSLKILSLRDNLLGDQGGLALADALQHNTSLRELYIRGNRRIEEETLIQMREWILRNEGLRKVDILDEDDECKLVWRRNQWREREREGEEDVEHLWEAELNSCSGGVGMMMLMEKKKMTMMLRQEKALKTKENKTSILLTVNGEDADSDIQQQEHQHKRKKGRRKKESFIKSEEEMMVQRTQELRMLAAENARLTKQLEEEIAAREEKLCAKEKEMADLHSRLAGHQELKKSMKQRMKKQEAEMQQRMMNRMLMLFGKEDPWTEIPPCEATVIKENFDRKENALGKGTFARVFKGEWQGKTVAIKWLFGTSVSEELSLELHKEMRLITPIISPFLLKTLGACTHGEPFLIISELMELGSLDQWVHKNKQSITFKMIIQLALEITHGLHHLHQEGIVHRDIKPENILLCRDRNQEHIVHAKLADFGTCRVLSFADSMTGKGTPNYMAPEVMAVPVGEKSGGFGCKADIFSLGAVFYFLSYHQTAFSGVPGIVMRNEGKRPSLQGNEERCPVGLQKVISHCWAQDPHDRPSTRKLLKMLSTLQM